MPRRTAIRSVFPKMHGGTAPICAVLVSAVTFFAFAAPTIAQERAVAKIDEVSATAEDSSREFYGRVVALETVDLAFQVGGQITEFPIVEGSSIEKGTMIASLDRVPFELALAQATAQFDQASRTLDRMAKLSGSSVSQATVDDAQTNFDLTKV